MKPETTNGNDSSIELGWYHINEVWHLYQTVDDPDVGEKRVLTHVRVEHICVDEAPDDYEGESEYHVDHYDPWGDFITSVRVTREDLVEQIADREPEDRPLHI